MRVKLLQQRLVLLIRHLLYEKLHGHQDADINMTRWELTCTKTYISKCFISTLKHELTL